MKRTLLWALLLLLLPLGCASRPAPAWLSSGHRSLEAYKADYLSGRPPAVTELHFQRALEEVRRAGDTDRLGRVWLTRLALRIASRETPEAGDYPRVEAAQPQPENGPFYRFLQGDLASVQTDRLPPPYRPLVDALPRRDAAALEGALARIDDPLSRLIAAGVTVNQGIRSERILREAAETASREGWKRPLLAWLRELQAFHRASGDEAKAEAVGRRIDLMAP